MSTPTLRDLEEAHAIAAQEEQDTRVQRVILVMSRSPVDAEHLAAARGLRRLSGTSASWCGLHPDNPRITYHVHWLEDAQQLTEHTHKRGRYEVAVLVCRGADRLPWYQEALDVCRRRKFHITTDSDS